MMHIAYSNNHSVKSVVFSRIRIESNAGKYGPKKTPNMETFHAVNIQK